MNTVIEYYEVDNRCISQYIIRKIKIKYILHCRNKTGYTERDTDFISSLSIVLCGFARAYPKSCFGADLFSFVWQKEWIDGAGIRKESDEKKGSFDIRKWNHVSKENALKNRNACI